MLQLVFECACVTASVQSVECEVQAVLAAAPDELFALLWDAFFAGSLAALTSGPSANFVVQAALASARTGDQVRTLFKCIIQPVKLDSCHTAVVLHARYVCRLCSVQLLSSNPDITVTQHQQKHRGQLRRKSYAYALRRRGQSVDLRSAIHPGELENAHMHWHKHGCTSHARIICSMPVQVKQALLELGDSFGELLSRRRSGVVAALLAAAGRLGAAQSEACRVLSRGLTSLPSANVEERGLAVSSQLVARLQGLDHCQKLQRLNTSPALDTTALLCWLQRPTSPPVSITT